MNILIVEDNERSLYLLKSFLEGKGHRITTAFNGLQALGALEQESLPDLIISDALMPEMDGFEFCYKLRSQPTLCNIPFILYTATYVAEQDERFAFSLGVDRFIIKPQEPEVLYTSILELMAEKSRSAPRACTPPRQGGNVVEEHLRTVSIKLEEKLRELGDANLRLTAARQTEINLNARLKASIASLENENAERRRSEELLRLSLQVGDIVTWESNPLSEVVLFSREARNLLLLPENSDEALKVLLENTEESQREGLRGALFGRITGDQELPGFEFSYLMPGSKQSKFLEVKFQHLLDARGQSNGIIGTLRDLSARHALEERRRTLETQLLRSQKMEALGNLAGGIAHDFNNMLTAIFGHAEIIRLELEEHLPHGDSHDSIAEIIHAAERSRDTIRQILTFSRRETVEHKVASIDQSVERCLRLVRSTIPRSIALKTELHSNRWALLSEVQLQQVLLNLCTNAAQALPSDHGQIEVSTRAVELTRGGPLSRRDGRLGPHILLEVRDNGCGMPGEVLERIFEPFFTTKPKGVGTGLGLAVVHGILQAHEASVTVDSSPGKGTCFHILFPCVEAAPTLQPDGTLATPLEANRPPRHILIVDDEPSVSHVCVRLLTRLGYRVTAINEATEARAVFQRSPQSFDAAIVDQLMPRLTGLDLIKAMQQARPDFPIIMAAGLGGHADPERLRTQGVRCVLNKPYSLNSLSEALQQLFP